MTRHIPPAADELEISIIGPGRGECVLLHLGNNAWCIIDSCIGRDSQEPVALEYLKTLNNDVLQGVRLVIASHWHDDHIRGLARTLKETPNASFACSSALQSEHFQKLVSIADVPILGSSGVTEFNSIYDVILERQTQGRPRELVTPLYAVQNRRLLFLPAPGRPFPVSVIALSPSDLTHTLALQQIAQLLPQVGDRPRRIIPQDPNHTSVAIWVEAGPRNILLGADLTHTGRAGEGWMAVVESHQQENTAGIFKVPHHGSDNGDYPGIWASLLTPNPVAVVTPFTAKVRLPRQSDLDRLSAATTNLYCTSEGAGKPPARDSSVERVIRSMGVDRQVVEGKAGHVRVRWSMTDVQAEPVVELFNGAYRVPHLKMAS